MNVNIDEFLSKYTSYEWGFGKYIPTEIAALLTQEDTAFLELPDNIDAIMIKRKEDHIQRDLDYAQISYYRNQGLKAERYSENKDALNGYLKSIQKGESSRFDMFHAYRISYDRAIALAHILCNRSLERLLIQRLMNHPLADSTRQKLSERLNTLSA